MDLRPTRWIVILLIYCFIDGACCNSVEKKIYIELNDTVPCVRLLNATHQIGCQSSLAGDVGVIHVLESEENLDWVLTSGPNAPYMVVLEPPLFTRSVMLKLKNGTSRVAGVAVVTSNTPPAEGFSPHLSCPNENTGVYSDSYGPALAHCNQTVWNPLGNGLSYEEFDFPIFSLSDANQTEVIRQCYLDHNRGQNGSAPSYPLCAMQLFSHMHAVTDTATCMRRNDIFINYSLNQEMVCDPLEDSNVWGSTKPLNNTAKGHKDRESVVIAAARLDSRAFFYDVGPGAESAVSGFVTLLAAAQALSNVTMATPPNRTIIYAFFQGEAFDYIGSSRMVYEMQNGQFAIDLDNVHSVLEVGQVGLRKDTGLWVHSDPVSMRNSSINDEVRRLITNLQTSATELNVPMAEPNVSQPLPPSSFQRFLRARPMPGVVVTDHQSAFSNRYYDSMYDTGAYLDLTYPPGLTPEQQLDFVTDTAKSLAEVATVVARALYKQAGGEDEHVASINADALTVTRMLYGFLVRSNNSWFQSVIPSDINSILTAKPPEYYVGVSQGHRVTKAATLLVKCLLANLTGSAPNITRENCTNQRLDEQDKDSRHLYTFMWVQGPVPTNGTAGAGHCVRSTVRLSKALSPAFDLLREYSSSEYSTWTESRWKSIRGRIFLVASHDLQMVTLGVGVAILLSSLFLTYIISAKADVLFSSAREPASATY